MSHLDMDINVIDFLYSWSSYLNSRFVVVRSPGLINDLGYTCLNYWLSHTKYSMQLKPEELEWKWYYANKFYLFTITL